MCLAVPMQVVALRCEDDGPEPQVAVVESAGIRKEIRLEMVDRIPELGEYVIIHAGFAIRTLAVEEAEQNLALMRQMAEMLEQEGRLPGAMEE
ncbi:MAG: HypC/HybG/HupF family hydrogenase formation chaperone [Desulfobulbaceae bacterium]|nr:HypC/HybG/HupF family hydrogenase formation chaperone [Desulfobulbaceae bacterium]